MKSNQELLDVFSQKQVALSKQLYLVCKLSIPAILAQIASVVMQYIDAAMVGSLGAEASASIGLVASSMWVVYGVGYAIGTGFSVQVAQAFGADEIPEARKLTKQAIATVAIFSFLLAAVSAAISFPLPRWLGASREIWHDATSYFLVFAISQPFVMLGSLGIGILQSTGNMKLPSFLSAFVCVLDVLFNALFIFPTRQIQFANFALTIPGCGLGVTGAALGTAASEVVVCVIGIIIICFRSNELKLQKSDSWIPSKKNLRTAIKIAVPMAFERIAVNGAQVMGMKIVAPLGTVSIAANSFATTAEAICYMPGFGVARAATTLTGQSVGANRPDLARRFAWLSVAAGVGIMSAAAAIMFFVAPQLLKFFTPDTNVQQLGITVLRLVVFAEPFYAASIAATGALRGVGDTLIPGIMNLVSMWGVRLPLAYFLSRTQGLRGVWIAMCIELCVRGILFLLRQHVQKWRK